MRNAVLLQKTTTFTFTTT